MNGEKIKVSVLGATGAVGQRFVTLLANHPWFKVSLVAASPRSAGKTYKIAVEGRWMLKDPIPENIAKMTVLSVVDDMAKIASEVQIAFSALDMEKQEIRKIEDAYAKLGVAVVSNNSAHRWSEDVPMVLPEINPQHLELINLQRKNRGWNKGLIVVKPNCSIQSYVPMLTPLLKFNPKKVLVTTFQAVSGAGKTMETWPEMVDNAIPFIEGEEEKSEKEPLRIWGELKEGKIELANGISISATCVRAPISDGHMASVSVAFEKKVTKEEILEAWKDFNPLKDLNLPSSPNPFITYFEESNFEDDDRPQTALDRDLGRGMGISAGRLRKDNILDFKFIGLSHNTIRGAAGGAILTAELLKAKGYI